MKKLFYLGLCALLTTGVGCALTNYELITDNDIIGNNQGAVIVNTNGKAFVRQSSQIGLIWPEGIETTAWFVDQNAQGDRTLTTYVNTATTSVYFSDELYCTPERQGCAVITASDPEVGDVDIYDYSFNANCSGARSIVYLSGTTRYYGECGRAVALTDRISLLNQGTLISKNGAAAMRWTATPMNTTITLNNLAGMQQLLPMAGSVSVTLTPKGNKLAVDLNNPMSRVTMNAASDFLTNYGSHQNQVSVLYNGIEFKRAFGRTSDSNNLRQLASRKF